MSVKGSSPLTRGKPDRLQRREQAPGLIPAHAGKTRSRSATPWGSRAHPRSRGENPHMNSCLAKPRGSSPLTRGKHLVLSEAASGGGLIPAHAGKTGGDEGNPHGSGAHPRSRGENINLVVSALSGWGSSPLTRGKPTFLPVASPISGLIPAHAGKTTGQGNYKISGEAHPRSRGENCRVRGRRGREAGSSPLTRGKRPPSARSPASSGLIPAHAGKTPCSPRRAPSETAHPRSRGENLAFVVPIVLVGGSSPLTRGKRMTA